MQSTPPTKWQVRRLIVFSLLVFGVSYLCLSLNHLSGADQIRQDSTITVPLKSGGQQNSALTPPIASEPQLEAPPVPPSFSLNGAQIHSLLSLTVGVLIVLIGIIGLKLNAFLALIVAALVVSLMSAGEWSDKVTRVGAEFGGFAGRLGLVIALAAVIGQSFLASGCAERIVNVFIRCLGEKRTPLALCGSGYALGIPVFFDTVFYLLVPLARSSYLKTRGSYLACLLAVAAGGTATHTMVPPTPGPLLVASNLGVNMGLMLIVGSIIGLFAAAAGMVYAFLADRWIKVPVRWLEDVNTDTEAKHLHEPKSLPPLWLAILPIGLPVLLIAGTTILNSVADQEQATTFKIEQRSDWERLPQFLAAPDSEKTIKWWLTYVETPDAKFEVDAQTVLAGNRVCDYVNARLAKLAKVESEDNESAFVARLNLLIQQRDFYSEEAFHGVRFSAATKKLLASDRQRMPISLVERCNRLLLEDALLGIVGRHEWNTPLRQASIWVGLFGDANIALLIAAIIALLIEKRQRAVGWGALGEEVEKAMASAGVIILITAAGGAFGAMLNVAKVGDTIRDAFAQYSQSGLGLLVLAFGVSSLIKIAQGSSTVAMITASGMVASMASPEVLGCHPVYLATAIGGGSLFGSWMNDSGFWIFAKMGYLTTEESLRTWTPCLAIVGFTGGLMSVVLAWLFPLV
ncbi:MAG: GntP family permease [Planctomycetaceae bacterium]|nr:GntP family permease [Planctomycetaceae bacterium]